MSGERTTSLDVARRAGVSQSAVSRVFTPGASASKRTVERVRQAAVELDYRPNILARSLITGRSRIIGLVVAHFDNHFYPGAIEELSSQLQAEGYHILVLMTSPTTEDIDAVVAQVLDYQVDGIITASVALSSDLASRCRAVGVPVVMFNRNQDDQRLSAVTSDNAAGSRKAAELLLKSGHRRISYIAGWEGASTQRDREAGFVAGLSAAGRRLWSREVGNFNHGAAAAAARRMFSGRERPDAVLVANDLMAFAVIDTLRHELGLRVPEDVAVVGYDDVPVAAWPAYDLTTVRQPCRRMVAETVRTLTDSIDNPDAPPRRIVIEGSLVVRGTTRRPERSMR